MMLRTTTAGVCVVAILWMRIPKSRGSEALPEATAPVEHIGESSPGLLAPDPGLIPEGHSLMILTDSGFSW